MANLCVYLDLAYVLSILSILAATATSMTDWWTYDGFSGPDFWGLVNPEWRMCAKGQHQSPVNIDPSVLLFDPNLKTLDIDKAYTSAILENTGQLLSLSKFEARVNISGGPLGAYTYRLHQILLHYGLKNQKGSEHTVAGERFPGEVQLIGYNADLYINFSEAMDRPQGLVGIAAMIDIGRETNLRLKQITTVIKEIGYKGRKIDLPSFSPFYVLPSTHHYVTYEGSLTYPGCYETVTWIVLNKPVYITAENLNEWQDIQRSEEKQLNPTWLGNNFRPVKGLNKRALRTNINFKAKGSSCPTMYKEMYYRANPWRKDRLRQQDQPQRLSSYFDQPAPPAVYIDKMDL